MKLPDLSHLAHDGLQIAVRVTPKAAFDRIIEEAGTLKVHVTAAPVAGKANAAVQKLLAKALGIPKTRLALIRGQTTRDKLFRIAEN